MGIQPDNQIQGKNPNKTLDLEASGQTRGTILLSPGSPAGAKLWDGGIVYFRFEKYDRMLVLDSESNRMIRIAMDSITRATENCIKFVEDTAGSRQSGVIVFQKYDKMPTGFFGLGKPNYIATCRSECLGQCNYKPTRITVTPMTCEYVPGNYAGSAAHEIMHALGFDHEFQRHDRDLYFRIDITKSPNFYRDFGAFPDDTKGIPMNYKSIMNYKYDQVAIPQPNPPQVPIGTVKNFGQECRIGFGDRNLIEQTYASMCRPDRKPRIYRKDYPIPGTDCSFRIAADDFDVEI